MGRGAKVGAEEGYSRVDLYDSDDEEGEEASYRWHYGHGVCSRLTFQWITPLFRVGRRRQINLDDLPTLSSGHMYYQQLDFTAALERLEAMVQCEQKGERSCACERTTCCQLKCMRGTALLWIVARVFLRDIIATLVLDSSFQLCSLLNPMLMRLFIVFMTDPDAPGQDGLWLALAIFVTTALMQPLQNYSFLVQNGMGIRQRAALNALIYRKSLRLSNAARQEASVGQIVNLMSNDANRFPEFAWCLNQTAVPIYLGVALTMLISNLGVAALSGIVVLLICLAINAKMVKRLHKLRSTQLAQTDERVKLTNEAILGIRVVK